MLRRALLPLATLALLAVRLPAEPLSRKIDIDFFRDVPSRNLKALATRSDGRLVPGPVLLDIPGASPVDLLWSLAPTADPAKWLIGTGPDGRILEFSLDPVRPAFTSRELARLDSPHVFALLPLPDGSLLAGTSPKGALYLLRDGKPLARVTLPVDSIFDILPLPGPRPSALVATGNPARLYRIDLTTFATSGLNSEKISDPALLTQRGISLFGEARDRNLRRIALLPDGRIAAGSAPKGNIYAFPSDGGDPVLLQENRDAEVTDLLPLPNGDLYATLVFSTSSNEARLAPPTAPTPAPNSTAPAPSPLPPAAQPERFNGRASLVLIPANGFPETLLTRSNTAFYRLALRGDLILLAGGELGELSAYDPRARLALTFAGSGSSQLNAIAPLPGGDKFLLLRNNAPGLALLDFASASTREAETRRLDLASPALLGALRFNRLRDISPENISIDIRLSHGSDEAEGWTPWLPLALSADAGWRADNLRGRYAKLRLRLTSPTSNSPLEIDRASLFSLPQNRRPQLQDFRILAPGLALVPANEPNPPLVATLNQVLQPPKDDDRRRPFLSSQVVPQPGTRIVTWHLTDPDGDNVLSTFSIRRDGDTAWTDLAVATRDSFVQFDTRHLADGSYFTRLVATETAPRPAADRLTRAFETDLLVIDHTSPEILEATARRSGDTLLVTVRGRDQLSLLEGIEVAFNNGVREIVEQPADGVRDGREETFTLEISTARLANATSLEVTLHDVAGNHAARRLSW